MNTQRVWFALISLAFLVAACGGADSSSSVSNDGLVTTGPGPSSTDAGSSEEITPNEACLNDMNALADLGGTVNDDQALLDLINGDPTQLLDRVRPDTAATFQSCRTAAEWDTAAALVFPSLTTGPSSKVDATRTVFCLGIDPVPPACSDE